MLVTGIMKKDNGEYFIVNGTGPEYGKFFYLTKSFIIGSHPAEPRVLQTTIFNIADKYDIKWKPENPEYDFTYTYQNAISIPQPIPTAFGSGTALTQTTTQASKPSNTNATSGAILSKLDRIEEMLAKIMNKAGIPENDDLFL